MLRTIKLPTQLVFKHPARTVAILAGQGTEAALSAQEEEALSAQEEEALSAQRREQSASKLRFIISGLPREKVITEAALSAQKRKQFQSQLRTFILEQEISEQQKRELKLKMRELESTILKSDEEIAEAPIAKPFSTVVPSADQRLETTAEKRASIVKKYKEAAKKIESEGKRDVNKTTTLHQEVFFKNINALNALIKSGVDIDARDDNGATPLHRAVFYCNIDAVKALIKAGADKYVKDKSGSTPLDLATLHNNEPIIDILNRTPSADQRLKTKAEITKKVTI